ncbi:DoxX family protein [Salinibacter sp. 10B]|uniref:DoxX family protein n=1 Tax=Salinibacter sp. 10B TaxID=1923971 RepID=UPI000CF3F7B3|nr:DoxX family protein [Salinibacter sp. 10B]PQJ36108.1 DoxX family protein [Salinibacter sp. 10B]
MPFSSADARRALRTLPLIRLMVGVVFVSEGLQKFLFPALRGPGRFAEIGFPAPEFFGFGVGTVEVICGVLLLVGLYTRWAAMPLVLLMTGALLITKLPILLGHGFGPFGVRELETYGFWAMMHAARTDWAMLLGSLVLSIAGAGPRSLDAYRSGPMV